MGNSKKDDHESDIDRMIYDGVLPDADDGETVSFSEGGKRVYRGDDKSRGATFSEG